MTRTSEPATHLDPKFTIGNDPALLAEVKTIYDMVGWFINPNDEPLTIERMNEIIAEAGASAR